MLITYTAYSQELPDAAVSALSLEKMQPKRDFDIAGAPFPPMNVSFHNLTHFFKQIDAPNSNDLNWQQIEDGIETNEDEASLGGGSSSQVPGMITNAKDLYKKFEDMVAKDHIKIGKMPPASPMKPN